MSKLLQRGVPLEILEPIFFSFCTMPLRGIVVSALAWHSLGREIESCPGIWELLSTKHAMKWLLSLCGGSDWGLGEPGWRPDEHIMWCQDWNLCTFTFIGLSWILKHHRVKFKTFVDDAQQGSAGEKWQAAEEWRRGQRSGRKKIWKTEVKLTISYSPWPNWNRWRRQKVKM